jgi:hypothetical protein
MTFVRLFSTWSTFGRLVCALALVLGLGTISTNTVHAQANCPAAKPGKYKVKIDSSPQGAVVFVGDKSCGAVGATPWTGSLPAGTFAVIIEATGYDQAQKSFTVAKVRKVQELFVPLVKKQDPPRIDVRADADKNIFGATVIVDGQAQGQAPMVITTTPGRHLVEIRKDGFEPLSQWVEVQPNQTQTMAPTIKEIAKPKYGTIIVEADVTDAEVYIDGNKHPDNTPSVINNVIEGVHVVEVRKPPALPWKQTIQVTASQQTKVRAELAAGMHGGVGVVRVLSDAQGARAFIDGTDMGPVPVDIKDVKAGEHIVQVKAPGFQSGEKRVTVAAGGSQIVKFDLNAEASGDQGILKIVSSVPDADVFIDGAAVGKVPQEKKVSAGEHPVTVRLAGYKSFEQKVRVEAGKSITVQADLKAVGRLRILSTPSNANVTINGLPARDADGKEVRTPIDIEVEVGENVVRIESPGYQGYEERLNVEGGKTQVLTRELAVEGKSEAELMNEQRGLSSFGARTLNRNRSVVDFDAGYPYFITGRVTVGAGRIAKQFGFDANVAVRTMLARTELGLGGRMMLVDQNPFAAAIFSQLWWGSKLLDDSQRNGLTWDVGVLASLTALAHVTITGRVYGNFWTDRHCPELDPDNINPDNDGFKGQAISVCKRYRDTVIDGMGTLTSAEVMELEELTGNKGRAFFGREEGFRVMASVIAEIAVDQRWNIYGVLEGAPFQTERALFTWNFAHSMFDTDFNLYLRLGASYKF